MESVKNNFHFDISTTAIFRSFKLWSFPLFKYAKFFSQLFLVLFVFSLLVSFPPTLFGIASPLQSIKLPIALLCVSLFFLEVHFFITTKVKKPKLSVSLQEALLKPGEYNMAEFLSLEACAIIEGAIKKSKQKKLLGVSSELLFYFALLQSKSIKSLMIRLGLDTKKLLQELNNHLEKQHKESQFILSLSDSLMSTIFEAAKIAGQRGIGTIGEKEILVGLSKYDDFFKKVLVDHDLTQKDIENITLWLQLEEQKIKKSKEFWSKENLSRYGSLGKDFASGFTITLDKYATDYRKIVRANVFNEVVGHVKEVDEVEIILAKSQFGNALIVGEQGAGRKSIVESLAKRCYLGTGLDQLYGKRVVELNLVSLFSQIQDPQKVEAALDQIFSEALVAGNVVLVIDQLDSFVGQKNIRPGAVDISLILGKYLALPRFHFIGITSFEGLHRNLEENSSFLDYFRVIEVSEVSEIETIVILQNMSLQMEKKYHILITYPAIREIINLTARYFPSTPFPKKAIDILEEAVIYVSTAKDLSLARNSLKILLPSHVAKIVSDKAKIPLGKMEFKEKSVLLNLENLIHQRIIGQDEAVSEISIAMRRSRSGLGSKKRPMGVFLFLGPTGVGKTETAKALAQIYFGGEEKMIRLDMSEFQAISDIPRLLGQVSPVEEQGLLTTPVRENPFSLVLLDEIEKAHPNILNLFLQVFDEGHITDGQGRKVVFSNTIIICTSNAGAQLIFQQVEAGQRLEKTKVLDFLFEKQIFKPEFINRFDAAIFFNSLSKENLLAIAKLNLETLVKNVKDKDIDFTVTDALKEKIVELSYKPEFGAREMRRVIQDNIENVIAQALLSDSIVKGDTIEVDPTTFEIIKNPVTN